MEARYPEVIRLLNDQMAEAIVQDWLTDYSQLEATELSSFAAQHENNHEVASALFSVLSERNKYPDVSDLDQTQILS